MNQEKVILVNLADEITGSMEKMEAHEKAMLHRAFSVFIFNDQNEMLIHQRADEKYHSGGLWTNACCSHPRMGETTEEAAHRRLMEEMGFDCPINEVFSFIYKAKLDQGLTEHEFDHVFFGRFNGNPKPNPEEVKDWKFVKPSDLERHIQQNPHQFTEWFKIALEKIKNLNIAIAV
ncbi:MAG: isopentenyl-diphosphate Delta-isomerase [Salibacteraceae bacterium]